MTFAEEEGKEKVFLQRVNDLWKKNNWCHVENKNVESTPKMCNAKGAKLATSISLRERKDIFFSFV